MPGMPIRMTPRPVRSKRSRTSSSAAVDSRSASSMISSSTQALVLKVRGTSVSAASVLVDAGADPRDELVQCRRAGRAA